MRIELAAYDATYVTFSCDPEILHEIFRRQLHYLRCRVVGSYVVPWCRLPTAPGDQPDRIAKGMVGELERSSRPRNS